MTDNRKDDKYTHGNVEKLVQIGKVQGGVTIEDTSESYARCPMCKRNDVVKKVSAIVAAGTHNMDGVTIEKRSYTDNDGRAYDSTERVPFSGSQASNLAKRLAPPAKPIITSKSGFLGYFFAIASALSFCSVLFFGLNYAIVVLSLFSNSNSVAGVVGILIGGVLFLIFGGAAIWGIILGIKNVKSNAEYERKERERVDREEPLRNKAVEKWKRLYYCERDDIVFDPSDNSYAPAADVTKFIYQNY